MDRTRSLIRARGMQETINIEFQEQVQHIPIWIMIIVAAPIINLVYYGTYGISIDKQVLRELLGSLNFLTGPKQYMNYCLFWPLLFKAYTGVQIYSKQREHFNTFLKGTALSIGLILLFFIEYAYLVSVIKSLYDFKISGHFLCLNFSSMLLVIEKSFIRNFKLEYSIELVIFALQCLNFYVAFWSALAYHSVLEVCCGFILGGLTCFVAGKVYAVNFNRSFDKSKQNLN